MYKFLTIVLLTLLASSCSIVDPWVYKINKQQGNITKQKQVDKLEIGMTKEQVQFIMGTPMSVDSFDTDRWDYIYTYKPGHGDLTRNNLTLSFTDNKLSNIDGKALIDKSEEDIVKEDAVKEDDEKPEN
ncbi:MAG: outer membrane protein assembly factor BamE [Gammaproteobacteria bacterium]|nr:outer membrane protein assembly factor BamE [Gammaproteobacteria bacterium]